MILKLNDEFLNQYHIKEKSYYNDNYYRLPFYIECDNNNYNILHISCDEFANEYNYALCCDIEDYREVFIDDRYIKPSYADGIYEIDLDAYSKEYEWC